MQCPPFQVYKLYSPSTGLRYFLPFRTLGNFRMQSLLKIPHMPVHNTWLLLSGIRQVFFIFLFALESSSIQPRYSQDIFRHSYAFSLFFPFSPVYYIKPVYTAQWLFVRIRLHRFFFWLLLPFELMAYPFFNHLDLTGRQMGKIAVHRRISALWAGRYIIFICINVLKTRT